MKDLKPDEIKKIKDYISIGKKFCEKEFKKPNEVFRNYYKAIHYKATKDDDRIAVPQIFSIVRTILPSTLNDRPFIMCKPNTLAGVTPAQIAQAVANKLWLDVEAQAEVELSGINFLLEGLGIVKVGWHLETKTIEHDEPREVLGMKVGTKKIKEEVTIKDAPFVEWVDPNSIYVSPDAKNLNDSPFIAHEIVLPYEKVKNNPVYKNTKDLKPTKRLSIDYAPTSGSKEDEKPYLDKVCLWEVYLKDTNQIITIAEDHDKELEVKAFPYMYNTYHPFVEIRNYEVPGEFYPFGEARPIQYQQKELDKLRTRQINYGKRFNRVLLIGNDVGLTEKNKKALIAGEDGTLVENLANIDGIKILDYPDIARDTQTQEAAIKEDIQYITGVSDYQRAVSPSSKRTATEVNAVTSGSEARPNEKLRKMEIFMARIAQRLISLAQQYYDETRIIKITDDEGVTEFKDYVGKDLIGDFNIEIEVGSTQARNPEMEKKQFLEFMDRFGQDPNINKRELLNIGAKVYKYDKNDNLILAPDKVPEPSPPEAKPVFTFDNKNFTASQQNQILEQLGYPIEPTPPEELTAEQKGKVVAKEQEPELKQMEMELKQQELEAKIQETELKIQQQEQQLTLDREKNQMQLEAQRQKMMMDMQRAKMEMQMQQLELEQELKTRRKLLGLEVEEAETNLAIEGEKKQLETEHAVNKMKIEEKKAKQAAKAATLTAKKEKNAN